MVIFPFTRKRDLKGLKEQTLSGHKLQLTAKVRYFGLTLYKGFKWKAQLKIMMKKAYSAFWTSTDTSDKTQGLKPSVLHWIYNRVF